MAEQTQTKKPRNLVLPEQPKVVVGGGLILHGTLLHGAIVTIDARPIDDAAPDGPSIGEFGRLVIPVTINGVPKRIPIPVESGDARALVKAFGTDLNEWCGKRIHVEDDPTMKMVRVTPALG